MTWAVIPRQVTPAWLSWERECRFPEGHAIEEHDFFHLADADGLHHAVRCRRCYAIARVKNDED